MKILGYALLVVLICLSVSCKTCPCGCKGKAAVDLFNGKDLSGWDCFLVDKDVAMEDVWSVQDGLLVCKGEPLGYMYTKKDYTNYQMVVEWRWAPGTKPGNNGVLLRLTEHKESGIPKCIEAQLKSGDAGNLYGFHDTIIDGPEDRLTKKKGHALIGNFIALSKTEGNENEPGQWNRYDISVMGPVVTVLVNGKQLNQATGCDVSAGKIGLQSEGGVIHFRKVKLIPIN